MVLEELVVLVELEALVELVVLEELEGLEGLEELVALVDYTPAKSLEVKYQLFMRWNKHSLFQFSLV